MAARVELDRFVSDLIVGAQLAGRIKAQEPG